MNNKNFQIITEYPGGGATQEQLSMLLTRYHLARTFSDGKDVLEVACGAGVGLSYLAETAHSVVGGDIESANLVIASKICQGVDNIHIRELDALMLPFADKTFDLVLLFEALYYLEDQQLFLKEAKRVLRSGGRLIISSVNCAWLSFNPSPFATGYLNSRQLHNLLADAGFSVALKAGFPDNPDTFKRRIIRGIRRMASSAGLIPKTMKRKELLKRIFIGRLTPIPKRLTMDTAPLEPLVAIDQNSPDILHKMLYAIALLP